LRYGWASLLLAGVLASSCTNERIVTVTVTIFVTVTPAAEPGTATRTIAVPTAANETPTATPPAIPPTQTQPPATETPTAAPTAAPIPTQPPPGALDMIQTLRGVPIPGLLTAPCEVVLDAVTRMTLAVCTPLVFTDAQWAFWVASNDAGVTVYDCGGHYSTDAADNCAQGPLVVGVTPADAPTRLFWATVGGRYLWPSVLTDARLWRAHQAAEDAALASLSTRADMPPSVARWLSEIGTGAIKSGADYLWDVLGAPGNVAACLEGRGAYIAGLYQEMSVWFDWYSLILLAQRGNEALEPAMVACEFATGVRSHDVVPAFDALVAGDTSRWFEPVCATDPNLVIAVVGQQLRQRLGDYLAERLFSEAAQAQLIGRYVVSGTGECFLTWLHGEGII